MSRIFYHDDKSGVNTNLLEQLLSLLLNIVNFVIQSLSGIPFSHKAFQASDTRKADTDHKNRSKTGEA